MKLGVLTLGAYRLIIVISFWSIPLLLVILLIIIIIISPSLSHLINVGLKSTLSEVSVATSACFGGHWLGKYSSSFHPKPMLISVSEMGLL
jgi:hypothetical protein